MKEETTVYRIASSPNHVGFCLDDMTLTQLAMLYKLLVNMYQLDHAEHVYNAGVRNCGHKLFAIAIAVA